MKLFESEDFKSEIDVSNETIAAREDEAIVKFKELIDQEKMAPQILNSLLE
jgi:hypothetical protein